MEVHLLGPFEVVSGSERIPIPGAKCRTLLAMLAVSANRVVTSDRLIEDLWQERPPGSAAATLQTYVYQLRRSLPCEAIITRSGGYVLEVASDAVDTDRFEAAVRGAATADYRAEPRRVASELAGALAIWRGRPLEDFQAAPWTRPVVARLEELRLATVERLNAARLALGEHMALVADLEALAVQYPLREAFCAQLMLALYRAERQAEALRAFAGLRRRLREELGIEPGRQLVQLEEAILLQKPELNWVRIGDRPTTEDSQLTPSQALVAFAPGAAAEAFQRALAVIDEQARPYDARRAELLLGLGSVQHQSGDRRAHATLRDAARLARRIEDPELLIDATLATNRRSARKIGAFDDEHVELLEAALGSEAGAESGKRASLLALLAAEVVWRDRTRAVAFSDEALELARQVGDDRRLWQVLATRQLVIWGPSTLEERRANAREQWDAADRIGDPSLRWSAITNLASAAVCAGEIAEADRLHRLVIDHCLSTGLAPHRALAARYHGWRSLLAGDIDHAERSVEEAFTLLSASEDPDAALTHNSQLFEIRRAQGRFHEVVKATTRPDREVSRINLAAALCDLDQTADAQELFSPIAQGEFVALPLDLSWLTTMTLCADVARVLDDRDAAMSIANALEPWRDQFAYTTLTCRGSIERPLGVALATAKRYDEANNALARAARQHDAVAAPVELARTKIDWARALLGRASPGDHDHARTMLDEAEETARRLGLATIERDAQRMRRALTAATGDLAASTLPFRAPS